MQLSGLVSRLNVTSNHKIAFIVRFPGSYVLGTQQTNHNDSEFILLDKNLNRLMSKNSAHESIIQRFKRAMYLDLKGRDENYLYFQENGRSHIQVFDFNLEYCKSLSFICPVHSGLITSVHRVKNIYFLKYEYSVLMFDENAKHLRELCYDYDFQFLISKENLIVSNLKNKLIFFSYSYL